MALAEAPFDLVLMDLQMPAMDGFEATAAIRNQESTTNAPMPIIPMTAHAIQGDRMRCLQAGMNGYVTKPVKADELYAVIAQYCPKSEALPAETLDPSLDLAAALITTDAERDLVQEMMEILLAEYTELTQGVQAWSLWILRSLQGWQDRCVTSGVQGVPTAMDAGAMALLDDAASGLAAWSADAVDVRRVAGRSPPAMELLCSPHHRTHARAASMDTVIVRPAGTVRDGWNRTGPHSRGAQPLRPGRTRAAPVPRAAG
jgi:hypothetical protein